MTYETMMKEVLDKVVIPYGARLTVIDENDADLLLKRLNFDTLYMLVKATQEIFFEVITEDGENTRIYNLQMLVRDDKRPFNYLAFVTNDDYMVQHLEYRIR